NTAALGGTGDISYQWLQDSTVVAGAESASYVLTAGDGEKTITVQVSRAGYSGTVASEPVAILVSPPSDAFTDLAFKYTETNIKFFSLARGVEIDVSKKNTTEWDIAIEAGLDSFCYIYTNSGDSASAFGSGGDGGVWFTDETDFDDVTLANRVTDFSGDNAVYADYVTDVTRYQKGMSGASPGRMNIMTYYGYLSGDGLTADTTFSWSTPGPPMSPFFEFNKKAFATCPGGMPPPWDETGVIYVIRLAGGDAYAKFQVDALSFGSSTYSLSFKFAGLSDS
ncbi:MAG: HmuY family protein, partial [Spirochaetaceae bacterium]|nr:HmuY family protein [Spirochaetaceae bacterium]